MKDHVQALNEISLIPWMQLLAILIALAILFFLGSVRVQAGLSATGVNPVIDSTPRPTDCLPRNTKNGNFGKLWSGDFTDVSNESVQSSNAKGTISRKRTMQIKQRANTKIKPLMEVERSQK